MASKLNKLERACDAAYERYVEVAADAAMLNLDVQARGISRHEEPAELGKLRRRAGAYRAQWMAASRALETAIIRREAY